MSKVRSRSSVVKEILVAVAIFVVFMVTRLPYSRLYSDWDEIWFVPSISWLTQGYQPYRDFVFGQPPFWLCTITVLWRVAHFSDPWSEYYLAKSLSIVSVAAIGAMLYLLAHRLYNSRLSGLITSVLFFFSANSFYYGVTAAPEYYATMLMILSIFLFLFDKLPYVLLSCLALGFAVMTRYSIAPFVFVLIAFTLLRARRKKDWKPIPVALFGLAVPALVLVPFFGMSIFSFSLGYVAPSYFAQSTSLAEKFSVFRSAIYTPTYLFTLSGALPFLAINRDWRKHFILFSLLGLIVPFFYPAIAEPHRILESEPLACIIGGAITIPFVKRSKTRSEALRISELVHSTQLAGMLTVVCLLMASIAFLANPRIDSSLDKVTDKTRNLYLYSIVSAVKDRTEPGDYVLCGNPLVAFLANRRMPPLLGIENMTEVSQRYDVKLVTTSGIISPPYFEEYVKRNYILVQEFPYWGSVYVRKW